MVKRRLFKSNPIWRFLLIMFSIFLILLSLWNILLNDSFTKYWPGYISIIFLLWFGMYMLTTYKYFRSVYLFSTVYIVSLAIFHLGHVVLHSSGSEFILHYESGEMAVWFERAGWSSLLALACLGLGIGLTFKSRRILGSKAKLRLMNIRIKRKEFESNFSMTYFVGIGLLFASLISLAITAATVGNIFQFSRTEVFGGVGDTRGFGFFLVVMPSAMILMVVGAVKRTEKWIAYALAVFSFFTLMMLGYRSSALFSALIGIVIWVKIGKKIPFTVAISLSIFVMIAIPTVRYLRDLGAFQDISQEKVFQSYQATKMKEVIEEIGGTNSIVAYTLKWVPAQEPYRHGKSYLWAAGTVLPNLGNRQASSDRAESKKADIENSLRDGNPADWFIYKTNWWKFKHGLGAGFSAIAEPYLNFGYFGIVVYFVGLGIVLGKLDNVALYSHPEELILSGSLLWPLMKTVRNSFVVFLKPLGLIVAAMLIWRIITFWKSWVRTRSRGKKISRQRRFQRIRRAQKPWAAETNKPRDIG